jgi:hypothetical protein
MKLADCRNEIIISLLRKFSEGIVYALRIQSGRRYLSSSVHREDTSNIMGAVAPPTCKIVVRNFADAVCQIRGKVHENLYHGLARLFNCAAACCTNYQPGGI